MAYVNENIQYFKALMRREFTRDMRDGHGEYIDVIVHGVTAIPNRCLSFHVVMREPYGGAMWSRVPIHALVTQPCEPLPLRYIQPWDCPSYNLSVITHDFSKNMRCCVHFNNQHHLGRYKFTIDYAESDLSEDPEQHKTANIIFLDSGHIVAQPNNRMQLFDEAYFDSFVERPDFIRHTHIWSGEQDVK